MSRSLIFQPMMWGAYPAHNLNLRHDMDIITKIPVGLIALLPDEVAWQPFLKSQLP
jgi:hypothetical protein